MQGLGVYSVLESELWSILLGLHLAQRLSVDRLMVESDLLVVVEAINQ